MIPTINSNDLWGWAHETEQIARQDPMLADLTKNYRSISPNLINQSHVI